jgi:uncharacterized protein (DUF1800 family)
VQPSSASVRGGDTQQFTAAVSGAANTTVTWTVNGIAGGNATVGTIDAAGLYTAPPQAPQPNLVTVQAASSAQPSASGSSSVTLLNPVPVLNATHPTVAGVGNLLITLSGSKFVNGAQIVFGGAPINTTFVSSTQLRGTASVTQQQAQTGTVSVGVTNPNPGSANSANVNLRVVSGAVVTPFAAARFLEHATFGPTFEQIQQVAQVGFEQWLADQFAAPSSTFSDPPAGANVNDAGPLQREFMLNALYAPDQLRLRTAFTLHKIWVVSWVVVNRWDAFAPYLRMHLGHAFDNYRQVMENVTKDPAMGQYQDIANNDKANPQTGTSCNENYGRELMQLFTIGVWQLNPDGTLLLDANGNPQATYDQPVVENNACALTGWTYRNAPGRNFTWPRPPYFGGPLEAAESHHDTSQKTLLNGFVLPAGQTAQKDLTDTLDNVFTYPSHAPHVAKLFIQQFVTSNPSPAYVQRVVAAYDAGTFTSNSFTFGSGRRGDMRALLAAVLLDAEARRGDDPAQAAPNEGKLREPILYLTGVLRGFGVTSDGGGRLVNEAANMGQRLFYPPTVFSYFSPEFQIPGTSLLGPEYQLQSTATNLVRANFANTFVYGSLGTAGVVDFTPWANLAAQGNTPLLDALDVLLLHGRMSAEMRMSISTAMNQVPAGASQNLNKARAAIYLVISSSQYQVQR